VEEKKSNHLRGEETKRSERKKKGKGTKGARQETLGGPKGPLAREKTPVKTKGVGRGRSFLTGGGRRKGGEKKGESDERRPTWPKKRGQKSRRR